MLLRSKRQLRPVVKNIDGVIVYRCEDGDHQYVKKQVVVQAQDEDEFEFIKRFTNTCLVKGTNGDFVLLKPKERYTIRLMDNFNRTQTLQVWCDMNKDTLDALINDVYDRKPFNNHYHELHFGTTITDEYTYWPSIGSAGIVPNMLLTVRYDVRCTMDFQILYEFCGKQTALKVYRSDTIASVKDKIYEKNGIDIRLMRLIYSGQQLSDEKRLHEYRIGPNCTLHLLLRVLGDVGEWVSSKSQPIPLESSIDAPTSSVTFKLFYDVIDSETRYKLIDEIKRLVGTDLSARDMKFVISENSFVEIVGNQTFHKMLSLVPSSSYPEPKIILRCRRVIGDDDLVIPFHLDDSKAVLNVALNSSGIDYNGGVLCFIDSHGKQHDVRLQAGDASAHDCNVVHGVSKMTSGVRYNVFIAY